MAQALVAVYGTSDVQTTAILRLAGYPAGEVYVALKTVFGTGLHEAEDILIAGGFTDKEAFTAVQEDLLAWYEDLIQQYGPVVYLHPDDGYEMSSIDWFFENTELYYRLNDVEHIYDGQISATNLYQVATDLEQQQGASKIWLGTPDPIKPADPEYKSPGFQESAVAYVHAQRIKHLGYTDLQFWLWYPYNGPGSFHTDIKLETFLQTHTLEDGVDEPEDYGNTAPLGEHASDWENVVLRFDNATGDLLTVFMSAHGHYSPYDAELDVSYSDGHVEVFSALNGHALFPQEGMNGNIEKSIVEDTLKSFFTFSATAETLNWTMASDRLLEAYNDYQIIAVDNFYLDTDRQLTETSWAKYPGTFGPDVDFDLTDEEKKQIILNIGGDALDDLKDATWGLAAEACAVVAAPCAAFFGIGYFGCYIGCYGGLVAGVHLALPIVLDEYASGALDGAFSDQGGTGKPSLGTRETEWSYIETIRESPILIAAKVVGGTKVSGNATVKVTVSLDYKVQNLFGDNSPTITRPYAITPDRIQFQLDSVLYDITDFYSETVTVDGIRKEAYVYDELDTTLLANGDYVLQPRLIDDNGKIFEYDWAKTTLSICNDCLWTGPITLDRTLLPEGDIVTLDAMFSAPTADAIVSVDWGDGSVQFLTAVGGNQAVNLSHPYADDGAYTITLEVEELSVMDSASVDLLVNNADPVIDAITFPTVPVEYSGASANVSATLAYSDAGSPDTHQITWQWGDSDVTTVGGNPSYSVTSSHAYQQGVYQLEATVMDDDGGDGTLRADQYLVVVSDSAPVRAGVGEINLELIDPDAPPSDPPGTIQKPAQFGFHLDTTASAVSLKFKFNNMTFASTLLTSYDAATSGSLIILGTGEVNKPANEAGGPDTVTTTHDFEAMFSSAGSFSLQLIDFEYVDLGAGPEWVDFDTGPQDLTKGMIIISP